MNNPPSRALHHALETHLQGLWDPEGRVSGLAAITDGWETEVHRFVWTHAGTAQALVLRRYPGADAAVKCPHESGGLRQLHALGYPVPEVLHHTVDTRVLGQPFLIMRWVPGPLLGQRLAQATPGQAAEVMRQTAALLARLHRLDASRFHPHPLRERAAHDPHAFIHAKLQQAKAVLLSTHRLHVFEPVLAWLEQRSPWLPCPRLAITHNDFHPFNILCPDGAEPVVIDWGNVEVADPRYDLGWSLMLAGSHGGEARRQALLDAYAAASGQAPPHIEAFEVMAAVRRLFQVLVTLDAGPAQVGLRAEALGAMRQQAEHLRAVLGLITRHTGLPLSALAHRLDHLAQAGA